MRLQLARWKGDPRGEAASVIALFWLERRKHRLSRARVPASACTGASSADVITALLSVATVGAASDGASSAGATAGAGGGAA